MDLTSSFMFDQACSADNVAAHLARIVTTTSKEFKTRSRERNSALHQEILKQRKTTRHRRSQSKGSRGKVAASNNPLTPPEPNFSSPKKLCAIGALHHFLFPSRQGNRGHRR